MADLSTPVSSQDCTRRLMNSTFDEHTIGMRPIHLKPTLELTTDMAAAYIDARLAARRLLREDRQRAARKGVETRRAHA